MADGPVSQRSDTVARPPRFSLLGAFVGVITRPSDAFYDIAAARPWRFAVVLAVSFGLLYGLVALAGPPPAYAPDTPPWLVTMIEWSRAPQVVLVEGLLVTPLLLALASGLCYLWARLLGGQGSFRGLLAAQAFTCVPYLLMLPVFLVVNLLLRTNPPDRAMLTCCAGLVGLGIFLWCLGLTLIAIRESMNLTLGQALGATVLYLGCFGLMMCVVVATLLAVAVAQAPRIAASNPPVSVTVPTAVSPRSLVTPTPAMTATPNPTPTPLPPPTPLISGSPAGSGRVAALHDPLGGTLAAIQEVAWSPEGTLIAVGSHGGISSRVRIWRADGTLVGSILEGSYTQGLAWSPDGAVLAVGTGRAVDLRRPDGALVATLQHPDGLTALAWSPDGRLLATSSSDPLGRAFPVHLWSSDGALLATMPGHASRVVALAWSPDSHAVASGDWHGNIRRWASDGRPLSDAVYSAPPPLASLAWSPDGKLLAAGSQDGSVYVLRLADGARVVRLSGAANSISGVAWSPDGQLLAASSADHTVWIWHSDGRLRTRLLVPGHNLLCLAWSPDGRRMATGDLRGIVWLWQLD